jgi:hypothetical protein
MEIFPFSRQMQLSYSMGEIVDPIPGFFDPVFDLISFVHLQTILELWGRHFFGGLRLYVLQIERRFVCVNLF